MLKSRGDVTGEQGHLSAGAPRHISLTPTGTKGYLGRVNKVNPASSPEELHSPYGTTLSSLLLCSASIRTMKLAAIFLACAVCFLVTGCTLFMPETTARIVAKPYVKPVLAALEAYHKSHNQYPKTLDELRFEYPKVLEGLESKYDGTLFAKVEGRYCEWTIDYKQETPQSYLLGFQRGACDATYRNGKLLWSDSNWMR